MSDLPRLSIRVDGSMTPGDCVDLARAAEAAGFAGVWFAENAFARGILPAAAACAVATSRIRINAGVFNPYSRHPTMMAMEIGALDELSGGRASLSLGAGIMSATERMGLDAGKPVRALRDALAILRPLLQGGEADHESAYFSARKVRLDYRPRAGISVHLAGRGDLTVKLAGQAADGLLVSNMCSLAFAGRSGEVMRESRKAAGRDGRGDVVQYMPASVGSRSDEGLRRGRAYVGEMLPRFWSLGQKLATARDALLAGTGIDEAEFARAAERLRAGEEAGEVLDDRFATAFCLAGTPEDCLDLAARYRAAGIDELALTFAGARARVEIAALGEALAARQAG